MIVRNECYWLPKRDGVVHVLFYFSMHIFAVNSPLLSGGHPAAWYQRRQMKKIYSPLLEGLLALYLGFEWNQVIFNFWLQILLSLVHYPLFSEDYEA